MMSLLFSDKPSITSTRSESPPLGWFTDLYGKLTIVFGAMVFLHILYVVFDWGGDEYKALISNLVTIAIYLVTWIFPWRTSRNQALTVRARRAWRFISLSTLAYLAGAMLWVYFESYLGVQPFPSLADIGYLAYFPLMMTGLLLLVEPMKTTEERIGFVLDLALIMIGASMVMWHFLVQPMITSGDGFTLLTVLSVAYPIGDLVLLLGIVSILMRRRTIATNGPVTLVLVGVAVYFAADFAFGYQNLKGTYETGSWVDVIWTVALLPIVLGAHYRNLLAGRETLSTPRPALESGSFIGLPIFAVVCTFGILTLGRFEGASVLTELDIPIAAAITTLLVLRQFMFLRQTKRAKADVTELQERIQGIYAASTDGIGVADFNGKFLEVNDALLRFTGYDREELLELTIYDITVSDDLEMTLDVHKRVKSGHETIEYEKSYRRSDGSEFIALVTVFPIKSRHGAPSAIAAVIRDITERKRSENLLREAEERWQLALRVNRDGVWDWDVENHKCYFSPRWREMLGFALDAEVSIALEDLFHPDDMDVASGLVHSLKNGSPYVDVEFRHRCHDNTYRWIRCRAEGVISKSTGRLDRVIGLNTDITERKLREAESNAVAAILRGVSETSNLEELLALVHEAIGTVVHARNFFVALHDTKTDLLKIQFFVDETDEIPASTSLEGTRSHYVFRTGQALLLDQEKTLEFEANKKFRLVGTEPKYWLGVPLRTPRGVIGVLVVQSYDEEHPYSERHMDFLNNVAGPIALAVERKRAESEMLLLNAALDNAANGIVITDSKGTIEWVNKAFLTLTGYKADEVKGKNSRLLKSGKQSPAFYDELWKTIRRGDAWKGELANRKKSGEIYDEEMTITPVTDPATGTTHFIAIKSDITERKRAEQQLKLFNEMLQRSNRELKDFANVASHDLQEPLRKVQTFADRLSSKYGAVLDDTGRDYLERMRNSGSRMQTLIQDLLFFSRVTTMAQPFEPVDLEEITVGVLSDLEVKIEETNAIVETHGLPTIDADPSQMRQLIQNLIGNALKFQGPGSVPRVTVSAERIQNDSGDAYQITFEDNGIGFDEKYLDKIFTVFQRLHGRTEYDGSGIGLAVCRKIVERHQGSITAISAPGQGARFVVTLPAKQLDTEVR